MMGRDRWCLWIGAIFLLGGIAAYGFYAMTGTFGRAWSFVLTMLSLGIFNLPAVLDRLGKKRANHVSGTEEK